MAKARVTLPTKLLRALRGQQTQRQTIAKKLQAEQLYEMLWWLQKEASDKGIPFRSLLMQVIVLGAKRLGMHPPRPIKRVAPPTDEG